MLDFKTLKELNQYNIKNVRVYSDGIFQLEFDKYSPYFYPNGQKIPHTDEIIMKPSMHSYIWKNTIRYSRATVENGENIWYWSYYDLKGNKLADNIIGDYDGPDNRTQIPYPTRPNDIPTVIPDPTDTQKMLSPALSAQTSRPWDRVGAYWFIDNAKFFQIPSFRKMFDAQYTQLEKYIIAKPQISAIESDYLNKYLDFMISMDIHTKNDKYLLLKAEIAKRCTPAHCR